jgi:UDP-3-O-[3-hydroxymyristoyl] glucosamine N-acyltransferase
MQKKTFTLEELAQHTQSRFVGNKNTTVCGVNGLEEATSEDVSFLANPRYEETMKRSGAGIFCIGPGVELKEGKNYLISNNPSAIFQKIAELLLSFKNTLSGFQGIHPTAQIHPTAKIEKNVTIGPYAVIDMHVSIGQSSFIGSCVYIGPSTTIGSECTLHPGCIIREECTIGNRVILQPGCVIGSCGFGYLPNEKGRFFKLQQLGVVILEDDVEIGANTTIDRARFKETKISRGSKIDNLVQIAHNVIIGEDNAIAAQTGIAGSSQTGKNVIMGGQVGITGHVEIGDGTMLATRTGVSKSLPACGKFRGSPALALNEYNRQKVYVKKLPKLYQQIENLEKQLQSLQKELEELKSKNLLK